MPTRRVVIVGAGLAGLCLARSLDRLAAVRAAALDLTLVSPQAAARLSPLLGSVLSGSAEPWQAHVPLRSALRHTRILLARAVALEPDRRRVLLEGPGVQTGCDPDQLEYDELVLACGTCTDHGGVAGAQERSLSFLSVEDALRIRNRLAEVLEAASGEDSARRRRAIASVVVQGSGVRACSAALHVANRLRRIAPCFGRLELSDPRVLLITTEPALLDAWGPSASRALRASLDRAGVEVIHNARVESVADDHVMVRSGTTTERVESRTVIWTDSSSPVLAVARWTGAPLQQGRLRVDELMRVAGSDDLHAIGECAATAATTPQTPARIVRAADWLAASIGARLASRTLSSLAPSPGIEAMLVGDQGLARIGRRVVAGRLARWLAMRSLPRASRSGESDPSRVQPSHQPLYLTPPPAGVR